MTPTRRTPPFSGRSRGKRPISKGSTRPELCRNSFHREFGGDDCVTFNGKLSSRRYPRGCSGRIRNSRGRPRCRPRCHRSCIAQFVSRSISMSDSSVIADPSVRKVGSIVAIR